MSLVALCIMDGTSNETTEIKIFCNKELAIQYVISQEESFLEDPEMISELYKELDEQNVIYSFDQPIRASYALFPTELVQ
jgi:hypothetical protein